MLWSQKMWQNCVHFFNLTIWSSNSSSFISTRYIPAHNLIIFIVNMYVSFYTHFIYRKSFRPAYAQLGMLGAIFPKVPVVVLTATATEQTRCFISSSLGMVDPESLQSTPTGRIFFYMCNTTKYWWWQRVLINNLTSSKKNTLCY